MTPAQEAREYAAQHGFSITTLGRRYIINYPDSPYDTFVAEVGGYPAALNAMKRYVQEQAEARRINKPAEGSPEWFARRPWRIVCGPTVWPMAYATRSDALKEVRRRLAGETGVSIVRMGA